MNQMRSHRLRRGEGGARLLGVHPGLALALLLACGSAAAGPPSDPAAPQGGGGPDVAAVPPSLAAPAAGPAAADPSVPGAVNMEFRDSDLPSVLRALCQGARLDFVLDPSVKGLVTAKLRNTTWQDALDIILKSHGLAASRRDGTLLIAPARPDAAVASPGEAKRVAVAARSDGKLDLDASGADLRDALRELAAATKMNIVASKDVSGSVTASLHGLGAGEILAALADSCGASVLERDGVTRIVPRGAEAARGPSQDAALPAGPAAVQVKRLGEGLLSIHAREAAVRDLLAQVASAAGMNLVTLPTVKGTISLDLEAVSVEDALDAISTLAELEFRPNGGLVYAAPAPPTVQTEAFRLRYSTAETVQSVITGSIDGAKVAVEKANNLVVVSGTPEMIAAVRRIVELIEVAPTQVHIETRIVETNISGDEQTGIDWSDSIGIKAATPTIPISWPLRNDRLVSESAYLPSLDPTDSRARPGYVVPYAGTDDFKFGFLTSTGLSMVLNMLQVKTKSHTVANPSITTVENEEATINIVTKYPIATYQVSSETGLLTVSGYEYKEFGTILRVTPRVSDGHITLAVHPEVSRQAGTTLFQGAELPIIQSQETQTQVRIKDGDTLVIAGLIREDREDRDKRVPWLGHIPLLGYLFRSSRAKIEQRRNLLIFITPHIVGEKDFAESAVLKKKRTEPLPKFDDDDPPEKQ